MGRLIALLGERYRAKLEKSLAYHGFAPLLLPDNPLLDPRLAGHADLSVFSTGNELILSRHLAEDRHFVNYLTNNGIHYHILRNEQSESYPADAGLCACRLGTRIIHNRKVSDPELTALKGFEWLNVRQGYAACAVCVLNDNTIMTADAGIVKAANAHGIECFEILQGGFLLEGFSYGFVGGSMFRCANTVYCTGTLSLHPDEARILRFLESKALDFCPLTEEPAFDVGGVLILPSAH